MAIICFSFMISTYYEITCNFRDVAISIWLNTKNFASDAEKYKLERVKQYQVI